MPVRCTCRMVAIGQEVTESREWNPECEEHGVYSAWYQGLEQRRERWVRRVQLVELQLKAAVARGAAAGTLYAVESYLEQLRREEPRE